MKTLFIFLVALAAFAQAQVYQGVATYFDGLGTPYGGCGVPQDILESQYFVALNVFNTPGIGIDYTRPLTGANLAVMGEFSNGSNCGRWVKVTIGDNCIGGSNDGALGQAFCRNGGAWTADGFNGSELYMLVTDACGDGNGWCRDSRYHLDLSKISLNNFQKNGTTQTNLFPASWNNRKISWEYVQAPNYTGDIKIWFLQGAQTYWPAIMINNLQNGIHSVQQKVGNSWVTAQRNSDMGQAFILQGTGPFTIRVFDSADQLVNGGREYTFSLPPSCSPSCTPPVTPVTYFTNDPLPVSILNFELKDQELVWWISSDRELYGVRILAASTENNWEMQAFIPASSTSTHFGKFHTTEQFSYYKLQCLDKNKIVVNEQIISTTSSYDVPKISVQQDCIHLYKISETMRISLNNVIGQELEAEIKKTDDHIEIIPAQQGWMTIQYMDGTAGYTYKVFLSK